MRRYTLILPVLLLSRLLSLSSADAAPVTSCFEPTSGANARAVAAVKSNSWRTERPPVGLARIACSTAGLLLSDDARHFDLVSYQHWRACSVGISDPNMIVGTLPTPLPPEGIALAPAQFRSVIADELQRAVEIDFGEACVAGLFNDGDESPVLVLFYRSAGAGIQGAVVSAANITMIRSVVDFSEIRPRDSLQWQSIRIIRTMVGDDISVVGPRGAIFLSSSGRIARLSDDMAPGENTAAVPKVSEVAICEDSEIDARLNEAAKVFPPEAKQLVPESASMAVSALLLSAESARVDTIGYVSCNQ